MSNPIEAMRTIANPISVHKFGGAALANADAIRAVVKILSGTSGERVVVTSALAGVTDILLNIARAAAKKQDPGRTCIATKAGRGPVSSAGRGYYGSECICTWCYYSAVSM